MAFSDPELRKKRIGEKSRAYWANITPEQLQAHKDRVSAAAIARWAKKTPEERSAEISACVKKGWEKISTEKRSERSTHMINCVDPKTRSAMARNAAMSVSLEERQKRAQHMRECVTPERKQEVYQKISDALKAQGPEVLSARGRLTYPKVKDRLRAGQEAARAKLTPEELKEKMTRIGLCHKPKYKSRSEFIRVHHIRRTSRTKGKVSNESWDLLLDLTGHTCVRCGIGEKDAIYRYTKDGPKRGKLTMDHIIPVRHEGPHAISNLQPLCMPCQLWKRIKSIDYRPRSVREKFGEELSDSDLGDAA